jgi:hypothetical protein
MQYLNVLSYETSAHQQEQIILVHRGRGRARHAKRHHGCQSTVEKTCKTYVMVAWKKDDDDDDDKNDDGDMMI